MANGRDKSRSRENRARVRALFLRQWNTIGLLKDGARDLSDDEYDAYVGKAYVMLVDDQADEAAVAAYLYWVATEYMGMSNHADQQARSADTARVTMLGDTSARKSSISRVTSRVSQQPLS